ncbi:hypothetical protein GH714_035411 [Hevea brasiliensis]|uniref:Major facilitator superfamily (MFS) profile domain-containing protein n=1 Tax=Hevea brasiliensis TaxID=3981 RepID=A0A6A6NEE9_HEVBR|nr:hypothetical protein GH714_035411 [Hevea brasiliensis]
MAWFSGKVSLGNFPDLAGAVNKLSESVKNIEKNFDSALGLEEKSDSSSEASGLWPVMSFMGQKGEDSNTESSAKTGSPKKLSTVEESGTQNSATERPTVERENQVLKNEKEDENLEIAVKEDDVMSDPVKSEPESQSVPVVHDVKTLDSIDNPQEKEILEVGPAENSESVEVKTGSVRVDRDEDDAVIHDESYTVVDRHESKDEHKMQTEEVVEEVSPVLAEISNDVQSEASSDTQAGVAIDPSGSLVSAEETKMTCEVSFPTAVLSDESPDMVPERVSDENDVNIKTVGEVRQVIDGEIDTKEQRLSSASNVSDSLDSVVELEKVKMEMKMMETALQGAARQAQAKADEIAKLMNENEQLKAVIDDLKVYALTKERDTLRREQNKKSDAAALLKEKDEIITQVMAEGEELSKKQAAQESTIRKLRAQVEENKVESIKKDKTATEKLLQETIEKHQAELAGQKEYYTNALTAAKEAEALAEARANNEARTELESRLREAGERENMLVQALEELRQTLSRKEQQAVFREDMLRRDIEDLQKRYQASERRCEELVTQVPESTRPLLRQIEAMQETMARRAEAWSAVERSLNSRLQEAEAKAAAAEERERSVNDRLSQTLSRINVLEAQISCLRAEQTQLSKSLEKERQRAAENRQEYLAAKEEADTQEGRVNQLEEEIKELRQKHKQELQDALIHRELLQQEIEREKAARLDLEKTARMHSTAASDQTPTAKSNSGFENGNLNRKFSSASSLGSMEESYFLQASLDTSDSFFERRNPAEATMSPYYMKSMTPSAFEAALRQKEGELASYMSRLTSMESIRDSLAEELVKMTAQCEKLRAESALLPGIRAELEALRRRHSAALELMGERDEELEELRADIVDLKEMYREQVNLLVNKAKIMETLLGGILLCMCWWQRFSSFLFGYHIGVVNETLESISLDLSFSGNTMAEGLVVSTCLGGAFVGSMFSGCIADGVGRRRALQLCALPMIIGASTSATTKDLWGMLLGRLFVGTGIGIGPPVAALYVSEVSPAHVRGTYGSLTQIAIVLELWGLCLLEFQQKKLSRGRGAEAETEFEKLLGASHVKSAMAELSRSGRGDDAEKVKISELIYGRHFKVVFIGSALFVLQQLSGINAIFYFSSTVFKSAGVPSKIANVSVGICNLLGSVIATLLMDKLGRKVLLIGSFSGMAVSMGLQAIAPSSFVPSAAALYLSVGGMLMFVLTFALGAGPVPSLLLSEIFPGRIRAKGMAVCMAVHWVIVLFWFSGYGFVTFISR